MNADATESPPRTAIASIDLSVLDWSVVFIKAAVGLLVALLVIGLPVYTLLVIAGLA